MTPTLTPIRYQTARMVNSGMFTLFHAWELGDGLSVEYWRGSESNGACLRTLHNGQMVSVTHYTSPGAAIRVLRAGGYPIPGVAPMTAEEMQTATAAHRRSLRADQVQHYRNRTA
jgi:hypothetical protein